MTICGLKFSLFGLMILAVAERSRRGKERLQWTSLWDVMADAAVCLNICPKHKGERAKENTYTLPLQFVAKQIIHTF